MLKRTTLRDVYKFPGFRTLATLTLHPIDCGAYVIRLERRQKKRSAPRAAQRYPAFGTGGDTGYGTWMPGLSASTSSSSTADSTARGAML